MWKMEFILSRRQNRFLRYHAIKAAKFSMLLSECPRPNHRKCDQGEVLERMVGLKDIPVKTNFATPKAQSVTQIPFDYRPFLCYFQRKLAFSYQQSAISLLEEENL